MDYLKNEEKIRSIVESRIQKCKDLKIAEELFEIYDDFGGSYIAKSKNLIHEYCTKYGFKKIDTSKVVKDSKKTTFFNFYFDDNPFLDELEKLKPSKKINSYKISFNEFNGENIISYNEYDKGSLNKEGFMYIRFNDEEVCKIECEKSFNFGTLVDPKIKSFEDTNWVDAFLKFYLLIKRANKLINQEIENKDKKDELKQLVNEFKIKEEEIQNNLLKSSDKNSSTEGLTPLQIIIIIWLVCCCLYFLAN